MSYPPRPADRFPGFFLGDFLSPAAARDFSSDPELFAELEKEVGQYRPWATVIHDGGNEAAVLDDLQDFLDQHLRTISFLMNRCDWDLFLFDLMATDRIQHELWHVWDLTHRVARGREKELAALRPRLIAFWQAVDRGVGAIEAELPSDAALLIMSDHGFGPIEHYVNFNVWLLERGDIALEDTFYVRQKHWCYRHGVTPEWIYGIMSRLGLGGHRVSRFRGKQSSLIDRAARVVVPVATAYRLVADARLCSGQFRPDLPERQGPAAEGMCGTRGRPATAWTTLRPGSRRSCIPRRASRWSSTCTSGTSCTMARTRTTRPT